MKAAKYIKAIHRTIMFESTGQRDDRGLQNIISWFEIYISPCLFNICYLLYHINIASSIDLLYNPIGINPHDSHIPRHKQNGQIDSCVTSFRLYRGSHFSKSYQFFFQLAMQPFYFAF